MPTKKTDSYFDQLERCAVCGRRTAGRLLFHERWKLCDACATRAMGLTKPVPCHDCGQPTFGVVESDHAYDMCVGCLTRRQVEQGDLDADAIHSRETFADLYEWRGRLHRFLNVLERLEADD